MLQSEWKPVSETQWAKNDEPKWNERKRNLHQLVTMDTYLHSGQPTDIVIKPPPSARVF
jgi:hypothetical protein